MAEFKITVNEVKSGKSKQIKLSEDNSKNLLKHKLGDKIKGELIDMNGYEFVITGGSDYAGFPMRADVPGTMRKKILSGKSVGVRKLKNKNDRIRKTVCGNTIFDKIAQINMKIIKMGKEDIFAEPAPAEETTEEKKE